MIRDCNKFLLVMLALFFLAGCSLPHTLILVPGRNLTNVVGASPAKLSVQKFLEDYSPEEIVGQHLVGKGRQVLKIKKGAFSSALDNYLVKEIVKNNISVSRGHVWDLSISGLDSFAGQSGPIVGGRITSFSIEANTGAGRLLTEINLSMKVDCLLGYALEKKIIKKTVYIEEKVFKFSANQESIEKVMDKFIEGAAQQLSEFIIFSKK